DLDDELVEEIFDVQGLGAHARQQDRARVGHLKTIRYGEQQEVHQLGLLDKGINLLATGLELLEGLHELSHFGEAEMWRLTLEGERRDVWICHGLANQVEQALEVQRTRPKGVVSGECIRIGTVESELDDGGFRG